MCTPVILQGLSDENFVKYCYIRLLNREPDEEGFEHYTSLLDERSRIEVVSKFIDSEEFEENNICADKIAFKTSFGWEGVIDGIEYEFSDPSMFALKTEEGRFFAKFLETVKDSSVEKVADVGSYKGGYAAVSSVHVDEVDCFELNPQLTQALKLNLKINELYNGVEINQKAVCEKDGEVQAHLKRDSYRSKIGEGDSIVFSTSLDSYYDDVEYPDVVKIDVEGAENRVLKGMSNLLSSKDVHLFVETHGNKSEIINHLEKNGCRVEEIVDFGRGNGEGIISRRESYDS